MKNLNWRQTLQFLWFACVLGVVEVFRIYWPVALILGLTFFGGMLTGLVVIR